jgi:N-acetylglucosaminyldiphosphoundecaprenol N-acetyl-beta-D-mannosaminyltransferase
MSTEVVRTAAPGGRPRPRQLVFGMELDAVTIADVVTLAERCVRTRERLVIGVMNAAQVVRLRSDHLLRESLLGCDVLLADGRSIVWASRLLGRPLPERVAGIDLFTALLAVAHRDRRRIFLLGGRPEVLRTVRDQVARRWPGVVVAGSHHGCFTDTEAPFVADAIAASGADLLFLGLTTPGKEVFLGTYGALLGVPVQHGVGGSFEVLAGVPARSPLTRPLESLRGRAARRLPRHHWRRHLVTNAAFVLLLARERVHPSHPAGGAHHA